MPTSRKARSIRKVTPDNREFEELLRRAANFFQRHTQKKSSEKYRRKSS